MEDDILRLAGLCFFAWLTYKSLRFIWRVLITDHPKLVYAAAPEDREEARRMAKVLSTTPPGVPEQDRLCVDCRHFREPPSPPPMSDDLTRQWRAKTARCAAPENMVLNVVTGVAECRSLCESLRRRDSSMCGWEARWFLPADKAE